MARLGKPGRAVFFGGAARGCRGRLGSQSGRL